MQVALVCVCARGNERECALCCRREHTVKGEQTRTQRRQVEGCVGRMRVGDNSRSGVRVLVVLEVDALQADDGYLAALEESDPGHHEEHEGNLEDGVHLASVLGAPWWVVPLLGNAVHLHEEREEHQRGAPHIRPLAPRNGEGMLRVVGVGGAVVDGGLLWAREKW